MAQFSGTIPLSDIERIQIYYKKKRNTKAGMKAILNETGGDITFNAAFFLNNLKPCCHLKVDGEVKCTPNYKAYAIAWDTPADFRVTLVPTGVENYMESRALIVNNKKQSTSDIKQSVAYPTNRTAVGIKDGRFAYLATQDNLTPSGLQTILADAGWDDAIMMDGGGSSAIYFANGSGFAGDGRTIPFWIVIHLKSSKKVCPYKEPTSLVKKGSRGEGAKWVQWHLKQLNLYNIKIDGIFGNGSVNGLIAFQKSVFTNPKDWDGICGPATRKALKEKVKE